ncbi:MAG: ABC transporter ATP-binding protein [bacterium]|jgi:putative ABC transport system ATP-binding protein
MILEISDLSKRFTGPAGMVNAVSGLSLVLAAGEFVAVQGPSGCGKSTLLLAAGGLLRPDGGGVRVAGQDPYAMPPEARAVFRAAHIGFVFQQFHLVPYLSVRDNVLVPTLALTMPDARVRVTELLEKFNLTDRQHHLPEHLSVGERQRTALVRALLNRPQLLLADEPTGNLDRTNAETVMAALAGFAKTGGAVLLVTHDDTAASRADRIVRIEKKP